LSALVSLLPKMLRRVRFGGDISGMFCAAATSFLAAILALQGLGPGNSAARTGVYGAAPVGMHALRLGDSQRR
jgi:hypothetical protein